MTALVDSVALWRPPGKTLDRKNHVLFLREVQNHELQFLKVRTSILTQPESLRASYFLESDRSG